MVKPKKWQNISIFANSLQFSSTGQCTNIPGSVRGTIPAHTDTPCSHQRMDKQGLFLPCNKSGIGKLSTGLRKADREQETKHLLHVEKTRSHCLENCIERVRHCFAIQLKLQGNLGIEKETKKKKKRTRLDFCRRELGDWWLRFVNVNPKMDELWKTTTFRSGHWGPWVDTSVCRPHSAGVCTDLVPK